MITFILTQIFAWLSILILFIVFILLVIWMYTGIRAKVPFIPVPVSILKDINKSLDLKDDSILYDLGCGDARVLFSNAKEKPKAKYIGIENSIFPIILARTRSWWHRRRYGVNVEILDKDFFTEDLSNATHIFTYLYPNVMDDLLPKFDLELARGTRLVSVTFKFTQKQPIAEIDLGRSSYKLARKIFIYEF